MLNTIRTSHSFISFSF